MNLSAREARTVYALLKLKEAQLTAAAKQIGKAIRVVVPHLDQEPGDNNAAKLGAARLGNVQKTEPTRRAVVEDPDAFLKWVKANAPSEVEIVERVYDAYATKLLGEMDAKRGPIDGNGEVVPGVCFEDASTPQQRFYADDGAEEMLTVVVPGDLPEVDGIDLAALLGIRPQDGGAA